MGEASEPLVDAESQKGNKAQPNSRPQHSPVEAFCAANARKLTVLVLLLLTSCVGFGLKPWLDSKPTSVDLRQTTASFQVQHDF